MSSIRNGLCCVLLITLLWVPEVIEACAVCYGESDSALTEGMNNGILVLLGVVAAVQIGFVALFASMRQRARNLRERKERFQMIQGGLG